MGAARKQRSSQQYAELFIERGGDEYLVEVEGTVEADGAVDGVRLVRACGYDHPSPVRLTDAEVKVAEQALLEAAS